MLRSLTPLVTSVRCTSKHWNPKYKFLRSKKYRPIKLPDLNRNFEDMTPEEFRTSMKERGLEPYRHWEERKIFLSHTGQVIDPYVPPEGDGKVSVISVEGAKQKAEFVGKKSKSIMAIRKIREFDENFETPAFCDNAIEIYRKAHELMAAKNKEDIINYVTEKAYSEILHNVENKTIRWSLLRTLDTPKLVHARYIDLITKSNIFAQLTVRIHTQQMLAVYDRFGRLMYGSEITPKDVLEYVVFESHVSNTYSKWRIHDKIVPAWYPKAEPSSKTEICESHETSEIDKCALVQTTESSLDKSHLSS